MSGPARTIRDVVDAHLCCGCGACVFAAPDALAMRDFPLRGRRPVPTGRSAGQLPGAWEVCPGHGLEQAPAPPPGHIPELFADWGPVLGVWQGHAVDPEVRRMGSSGGAATALCEYQLHERGGSGVLQTASDPDAPLSNKTVFSTTAAAVRACSGSRYSPASPCEGLAAIRDAAAPAVFVGKPCDVAGARKAAAAHPALAEKLGLALAVFCAGTPSTQGTLELLADMGLPGPEALASLRYRGNGWPGPVVAETARGTWRTDYAHAWNDILQRHRPWRCYLCPDHCGEFADVALGDPWHIPPAAGDEGRSLIVARTPAGLEAVSGAMAAGYLAAAPVEPSALPLSQPSLLRVRGGVWGRVLACRALGIPVPDYRGMPLFSAWRQLCLRDKLRSLLGPLRRKSFVRFP